MSIHQPVPYPSSVSTTRRQIWITQLCYAFQQTFRLHKKRFCGAEKTEAVETLSAFRNISQFSNDYGVAIEDSSLQGLTSRAVIILNESNEVIYSELVNEITEEPNYDQALSALR